MENKSCGSCRYAKRPKKSLPKLCTNEKAKGFALPWEMPIKNCEYWDNEESND